MGCAGSAAPYVPKGDGFFALPWPSNAEKENLAHGRSRRWADQLPIFAKPATFLLEKFDKLARLDCMILMNQDALFQKLLEEKVDALPFPPDDDDAIVKGAKASSLKYRGTLGCRILLNQSAIFKKLSGDEVPKLPYPPDNEEERSQAEKMNVSGRTAWDPLWDYRVLCNDHAIFCKLAGHSIKTLPFPPDETVTRLAGEESRVMWDCQQIMNQHSILQKVQVACLLGTVHTPKSLDGSKLAGEFALEIKASALH